MTEATPKPPVGDARDKCRRGDHAPQDACPTIKAETRGRRQPCEVEPPVGDTWEDATDIVDDIDKLVSKGRFQAAIKLVAKALQAAHDAGAQ